MPGIISEGGYEGSSMHWISEDMLITLGILSIVFFVGTLIVIPILIVRLPVDYFDENQPRIWLRGYHPAVRITTFIIKNAAGAIFLLAGIAMLLLPGQGLLTMIIGISLLDFPGKRRLERKLIGRPKILSAVNALREKFQKPPLVVKAYGD
jgi:hypothetical protein